MMRNYLRLRRTHDPHPTAPARLGAAALAVLLAAACVDRGPRASRDVDPAAGADAPAGVAAEPGRGIAAAERVTGSDAAPLGASRGVDSVRLAAAYARAAELPRLYSLLVARHGKLVGERYYNGRTANTRANIKSASKSVLSALVGIAIAEGALDGPDQRIAPFFADHIPADADARMGRVTLAHLLSMQTGMEPTSFGNYGQWVSSRNWVRYVVTRPFVDQPGGRMLYSTGSTHLLSAILTRATERSTLAYARERLARPLGFELPAWTADPQGIYFGGNEMSMRPRDLLTFGELYRNGGRHEGRQLVPEAWVRESWRQRTTSPFNGHGYGLGWWIRRSGAHDVFFAWGYGGQYLFIVPSLELTVVMTSDPIAPRDGGHNRALHRLLDDFIIPAAAAGAADSQPMPRG